MSRELFTFILEGASARNGNIPADVFIGKLKQFVATVYAFDRIYSGRSKRGVELDVVDLKRVNPSMVLFNPRAAVRGYDARESMTWTVGQLSAIRGQQIADPKVSQEALDNIIDLASVRRAKVPSVTSIRAEYSGQVISFDEAMIGNAMVLRSNRAIESAQLWKAGVSKGSVFGRLCAATEFEGEKRFWVATPNGKNIQCVFSEDMRAAVQKHLWGVVRAFGTLKYDGSEPTPYLIDADRLEPVLPADTHMADMYGAFRGLDRAETEDLDWLA